MFYLILGNDEYMPVEECGNMIFMSLAYAQFTDNVKYLKHHYKILKQWTSYLVQYGLVPATQGTNTLDGAKNSFNGRLCWTIG